MNFMKSIAILISGELSLTRADGLMALPPLRKTTIDIIFICINLCSRSYGWLNKRLDCLLFHIFKHGNHNLASPLDHAKHRWFFFLEDSSATSPFQSFSMGMTAFLFTASALPLCPATTYTSSHSTSSLRVTFVFALMMPLHKINHSEIQLA